MAKRTYLVEVGGKERLVKTPTKAQTVNYIAADTIRVRVATQDDLERLLPLGVAIEHPTGTNTAIEGAGAAS